MAFHIKDPATNAAVREQARRRGISLTAAVREAVEKELARSRRPLKERIAELAEDYRRHPLTGLEADKAFFDELSGNG